MAFVRYMRVVAAVLKIVDLVTQIHPSLSLRNAVRMMSVLFAILTIAVALFANAFMGKHLLCMLFWMEACATMAILSTKMLMCAKESAVISCQECTVGMEYATKMKIAGIVQKIVGFVLL